MTNEINNEAVANNYYDPQLEAIMDNVIANDQQVDPVPVPDQRQEDGRLSLEDFLAEKKAELDACKCEGESRVIMAISNSRYKKSLIAFKKNDGDVATTKIFDWSGTGLGTVSAGLYTLASGIKMFANNVKEGKITDGIKNIILASNTSAAVIYAGKAIYDGKVSFSTKSTMDNYERKVVEQYSMIIADTVRELKEAGYNVMLESMERNTIISNGQTSSDLFALRDAVAVFSDVNVKDKHYRMATVDITVNGYDRKFNMFTKFRKDDGVKGIIKAYKDKRQGNNAPVEFYVESPYRATLWDIYNATKGNLAAVAHAIPRN